MSPRLQHGGAVGNHGHQIAARRVAEGVGRVLHDLFAGERHTGRVGQREIVLIDHLFGRGNYQLTRLGKLVVLEAARRNWARLSESLLLFWAVVFSGIQCLQLRG